MPAMTTPQTPFIALSGSYLSPTLATSTASTDPALALIPPHTLLKLRNVGPSRIRDMRAAGVSMQVISHLAMAATPQTCARLNDALNASTCVSPDRFAALALLPVDEPKAAARELQRCVLKYRFVGGVLPTGLGLGGAAYDEVWDEAEKYRVPIVLREAWPSVDQARALRGNFPEALLGPLVANFHAAHSSSPLPLLELWAAGTFDKRPNLRLITSQSGLTIASLLTHIGAVAASVPSHHRPARSFLDVWQRNIYVSTEDVLDLASLRALLEQIPIDRVLHGTMYPFQEKDIGLMAELRESGVVGVEEWERVAWRNAEGLFGLKGATHGSGGSGSRSLY